MRMETFIRKQLGMVAIRVDDQRELHEMLDG